MPAPESIRELVQRFDEHISEYRNGTYNETQLRREFLDPFFEALGWDVFNRQGYAEAYKDVVHEDAIKIGGATKAPDYAFRIGGVRKFFVEAKKPAVNVREEVSPAYQLRRYAWSAKLPLSILTDFEEFAVYECRSKPDKSDKASMGRVELLHYTDYVDQWDYLVRTFSREAILKGSFDRYAEGAKGKHGTAEVDDAFLAEIERWRDWLAHNLALRNPHLTQREMNYAVQMTIDRIIFLRICEDRGIEFYGQLQALVNGTEVYPRLCQLFKKADERYDSGLFHFHDEKGQTDTPDQLTPSLAIDDKPLKDILRGLYYPESPYEFSVLPANILGQVYEQFLGKVIRLTDGHHAVVEDKPEVKKAGGVYYTPTYIVDYIVRQTVGSLLDGKHPGDTGVGKGEPLRVLDPACGSGSFLLGAYQYLLDWYRDGYTADGAEKWAKGKRPTLYQNGRGEWKLTTAERKRILLDHIYGVDIDAQAVEVTKLSLLLKVLEGESEQSLTQQMSFWQTRALPDLSRNIQCGNSLIGPDFYDAQQMSFLDTEEQYRINAFDWERAFPQVFAARKPKKEAVFKPALSPAMLSRCRELRKNATDAENLLWQLLRDRQLEGLKFRRQHPLGGYILDFYCHEERLAIELDGSGHLETDQARRDEQRTKDLAALGVRVIRFWNHDVLGNPQGALLAILAAVEGDPYFDALVEEDPHPNPLPMGEGATFSSSVGEDATFSSSINASFSSPGGRGARGEGNREGGFDAVIGNPPYIRIQALKEWAPREVEFYKRHYTAAGKGNYDIYVVFVEKGLKLLNPTGRLGYILPHKFFNAQYGEPLREIISKGKHLSKVVHFGDQQVFNNATTYTCLMFLDKTGNDELDFEEIKDINEWRNTSVGNQRTILNDNVTGAIWNFALGNGSLLFEKLSRIPLKLENVTDRIFQGIKTSADKIYIVDEIIRENDRILIHSPQNNSEYWVESDLFHLLIKGGNSRRYFISNSNRLILFPYAKISTKSELIPESILKKTYPLTWRYLNVHRQYLENRENGKMKGSKWYGYIYPKALDVMPLPKIFTPDIAAHSSFSLDDTGTCFFSGGVAGGYGILVAENYRRSYILGLLNSKLLEWFLHKVSTQMRGGYYSYESRYIRNLPIALPEDKDHEDFLIKLVDAMLALHQRLAAARLPQEKEMIQRQIETTDRQIDRLVYELYGLTEEEIRIVEGE